MMMKEVFELAGYQANFYALPPLLVGVLIGGLGLFVLIRERATPISLSFLALTTSAALWLVSIALSFLSRTEPLALAWNKVEHLGVLFIPSTVYIFALSVTHRLRQFRVWAGLGLVLSGFFYGGVLATDEFISGMHRYFWGYYAKYGPLSLPFFVFFFAALLAGLGLLWEGSRHAVQVRQKKRLKAMIPAFAIGYLGSLDFLPTFGIGIYPIGYIPVLVFVIIAAHAIWRYRLVDLTPSFAANQILATMNDLLIVCDGEKIIRVVNEAVSATLGYARSELVGEPVHKLAGEDPEVQRTLASLLEKGVKRDQEMVLAAKNGQRIEVSVSLSSLHDENHDFLGSVLIARDIRERKRHEEKFRGLMESAPDAIIIVNQEKKIHRVNSRTETMFGYPREALLGNPVEVLLNNQRLTDFWSETGAALELRGRRKNGSEFPAEVSLNPLETEDGLHIIIALRDITLRKRSEEELRIVNRQLKQKIEELERLNRVMLGREERILELKQAIRGLRGTQASEERP